MFAALSLLGFVIGGGLNPATLPQGRTMAFMVLAFSQVLQSFNMRSDLSLFKIGPFTNRNLNLAALASLIMVAFVLFVPGVNSAFGLVSLEPVQYLIALGLILVPLVVMEISKALGLIKHKH